MSEHFRCDDCGRVMDDPPTAPEICECGGTFWRYVRAQFASAVALQLNYMLGPFCEDEILDQQWEQQSLLVTDGGYRRP